ncbi:MAG: M6 family metalloprotease domain-containing protein [Prevotella sp.]
MRHRIFITTLIAVISFMTAISVYGIPSRPVWRSVTLRDGTKTQAMLVGDEHGHWYIAQDGSLMTAGSDGRLSKATEWTIENIKAKRDARTRSANARRERRLAHNMNTNMAKGMAATTQQSRYAGKHKGLVILVSFADKAMATGSGQEIGRMLNEVGYSGNNHAGSLHDYFYDQSYGTFDLSFDVIGPVTVSKALSYYGANDSEGNDMHVAELASEAVRLADGSVNYADYDWDGDGEVDQVMIVYAGYGENEGAPENTIWPHEWSLTDAKEWNDGSGPLTLDGVTIDTYAMSAEMSGTSGKILCGIGTICHEFSHCLGYPDFYDTTYSGGQGMTDWDVMCQGSYNGYGNNGECPPEYTAYERWMAGWLTPVVLDKPCRIRDMAPLSEGGKAYVLCNEKNTDEYYILENRQSGRWTTHGGQQQLGHGMLVVHVDYNETAWTMNTVNDVKSRQRMTYIPADNSYGTEIGGSYVLSAGEIAGDTYPGQTGNAALTDNTVPAATLNSDNTDGSRLMHKAITEIAEDEGGMVSFTFRGGVQTPEITEIADIKAGGFTVRWQPVAEADSYTVRATPVTQAVGDILLTETFSKCSPKSDREIAADKFDNYTETPGWRGYKVYPYVDQVKISSSSVQGHLMTPTVTPQSGYLTIYTQGKAYKAGEDYTTVALYDSDVSTQLDLIDVATYSVDSYSESVINFKWNTACRVGFMPNKRLYLSEIRIYDGCLTLDDVKALDSGIVSSSTADVAPVIVSGITATSYTFTGLPSGSYSVSVSVTSGGVTSDWSTASIVEVPEQTTPIIPAVTHASKLQRIYSVDGRYVGDDRSKLGQGVYVTNGKKILR